MRSSTWIRGLLLAALIAMLSLTTIASPVSPLPNQPSPVIPPRLRRRRRRLRLLHPRLSKPCPSRRTADEITIFAASSLTDAFNAIGSDLEAANPGLDLVFNFAGSQALVTQLTEGAKADVFASANNSQMKAASDGGVIAGEPQTFAHNRLAIVVPKDNPAGIASIADLGNDGVKLVLAAEDVPVGQYARQSICIAGADTATYGDGFVDNVSSNIVSNETNVKNVLAKVQLGEADAGIVYVTDVTSDVAADVTLIEIPDTVNVIASYPVAAVTDGNADAANAFITYLLSAEGQATLASFGFQSR